MLQLALTAISDAASLALRYWRVLAVVALLGGCYVAGWTARGWRADADAATVAQQRATERTTAALNLVALKDALRRKTDDANQIAADLEATRRVSNERIEGLLYELSKQQPVPAACVLDAGRLRILKDATTG